MKNKKTIKDYRTYSDKIKELEGIIAARLSLQSTQSKICRSFNLQFLSLNELKSSTFLKKFFSWPEIRRKEFVSELAGTPNFKQTTKYLESLRAQNEVLESD